MVTMSNCKAVLEPLLARNVQVQQPVGRLHHNSTRRKMNADDHCVSQRNQNLCGALPLYDEPASNAAAFDAGDGSDRRTLQFGLGNLTGIAYVELA